MKKFSLLLYTMFFLLYEEILFNIYLFKTATNLIYIILFSLLMSLFIYTIIKLFDKKISKILTYIVIIIYTILFIAQFIYFQFYQSLISIYSMFNGGQVFEFWNTILDIMNNNIFKIISFLIPVIILIVLNKTKLIDYRKGTTKENLINVGSYIIFHIIIILLIFFTNTKDIYSNKNLYFNSNNLSMTANRFGLTATMRLDFEKFLVKSKSENIITSPVVELEDEKQYNIWNIDFDELIKNETNENIIDIHKYMKTITPTEKNKYTGMFKGKNLVIFVAEAFSDIAIDKDITPNLYKLYTEGFQFNNFYTPVFPVSTADGEYITDTSLIPKEGVWSLSKLYGNTMPLSIPNLFEPLGYSTNAYHDHYYKYYKRNLFMETMGYDSYLGCGNGIGAVMSCKNWPNSDYEMVKGTVQDYINNDSFVAYYMTVSGHLQYTKESNSMVNRNWKYVKDLPYSNKAKSYLAAQKELDKCVGELIEELKKKDKLDDTVIVLSADHYPYGLMPAEINELSNYKKDSNFDVHKSALLIWNSKMKNPIEINKYSSSLDILPTILNLFGINYDSRLIMGSDILSNSNSLVIFSNRSFITDKGRYNSITDQFENFEEVSDDYVDNIKRIIKNKYLISEQILDNDYYKYIKKSQ